MIRQNSTTRNRHFALSTDYTDRAACKKAGTASSRGAPPCMRYRCYPGGCSLLYITKSLLPDILAQVDQDESRDQGRSLRPTKRFRQLNGISHVAHGRDCRILIIGNTESNNGCPVGILIDQVVVAIVDVRHIPLLVELGPPRWSWRADSRLRW